MFSVWMRTATQNLVKWYLFKLAPVFCMEIHLKSDQLHLSVYRVFLWPIKNENSQFSAEKDTKVSILKFTLALTFYIVQLSDVNWSTSNFLTFKFHYREIIWQKIKFIACQGVTWSLFCRRHSASSQIFHCIYIEFSSSTFSVFWHLYLVLIGVFFFFGGGGVKTYFCYLFIETLKFNKKFC